MKTFRVFVNEASRSKYTDKEVEGLIAQAVEEPRIVYVDSDASQMSPKKTTYATIPVSVVKLTTDRIKPLNLNHVQSAKDADGIFVRSVRNNPIAVVLYDKDLK